MHVAVLNLPVSRHMQLTDQRNFIAAVQRYMDTWILALTQRPEMISCKCLKLSGTCRSSALLLLLSYLCDVYLLVFAVSSLLCV